MRPRNFSAKMVQAPGFLKKVFDTFPLLQYPAVNNSTPAVHASIEEKRFSFEGEASDQWFTLGVYNVFNIEDKYLPTDPMSLYVSMYLCQKYSLKFPRSAASNSKSKNALLKLSYYASPNNFLPILIEDSDSRDIKEFDDVETLINMNIKKSGDVKLDLINDMIDKELVELWILILHFEADKIDVSQLLGTHDSLLTNYELQKVMKTWKQFDIRYPKLNESLYISKLNNVGEILQLVTSDLDDLILLKIYAWVIIANHFFSDTKVAEILPQILIEDAYKLLHTL